TTNIVAGDVLRVTGSTRQEEAVVASVAGATVTLQTALVGSYTSGSAVTVNPNCETSLPVGVGAMIFGGDFDQSASDEIGHSMAVGNFDHASQNVDVAIGSVTHERVYLV